ncbi:hypothetical protein M408DRAFT_326211 [Serendipita vermifera MAFF 305830]|uniref:Aminotransferase class I/classII large domain-containing protein n=1 Tax=Serendipita vermifera MAFF 305830 TaxID=933852 RepID=A0A0C2XXD2_SERVB|nr:hypothetical protein M408DRAFT_326211 [Serendipita vermifera MAFF 305830]
MISMLAGKPNPSLFPITSIAITVRSPLDGGASEKVLEINGPDLEEALQYGPTSGIPKAERWFKGLQERAHHRKQGPDWDMAVGSGSQDLLYKAFLALLNPGEAAMVEAPVYAGAIPLLLGQGAECIEIRSDGQGVDVAHMRKTLQEWPVGKPKPKVFYTVPYGGNPNGATASLERRLEVLRLAHEHNFIIMEDDPYFYLYFGTAPRPPSYWELEGRSNKPRGRVLRFDSFSKVLSSGLRLGLVSGPRVLVEAINLHSSTANLQVSSTTQAIAYALLSDWGYEAFFEHSRQVSEFYRVKRDIFLKSLEKHMTGLAEWTVPDAGMFFWMKLLLPETATAPDGDSEEVIRQQALKAGVLALPGKCFFADGRTTPYVRASFSLLEEADAEEGLRRLAEVVRAARDTMGKIGSPTANTIPKTVSPQPVLSVTKSSTPYLLDNWLCRTGICAVFAVMVNLMVPTVSAGLKGGWH